jgi:hypothetical protein
VLARLVLVLSWDLKGTAGAWTVDLDRATELAEVLVDTGSRHDALASELMQRTFNLELVQDLLYQLRNHDQVILVHIASTTRTFLAGAGPDRQRLLDALRAEVVVALELDRVEERTVADGTRQVFIVWLDVL